MSKKRLVEIVSTVLLIATILTAMATADDTTTLDQPGADPFVGWYTKGLLGDSIHITREGDSYRMHHYHDKDWIFKKREHGVLEDEDTVLGTLTLGHLNFVDAPNDSMIVVKAKFCYEHFLLIKQSETPKAKKTDAPESAEEDA